MSRIFSGIQPTGDIHIGNYLGAIRNWVKFTDRYDCIYCIVDYHAMTIEFDPKLMPQKVLETALVLMACGLTPDRCIVFVQSQVPEHTELTWIFNCVASVGELERMTQFKDKAKQHRQNVNMGLLDYPVLQAADILIYKAQYVPVGKDQYQHVELTREIARRFNKRFGDVFPEPEVLESQIPKILGLDGRAKMSKSMNNAIGLLESPEDIWEKLRTAVTDVNRIRRSDPGDPGKCNIFTLHKAFSGEEDVRSADEGCRSADIGCIECKRILWKNMTAALEPIQQKAAHLRSNMDIVREGLIQGGTRCKEMARELLYEVRERVGLCSLKPEGE